VKRYAKQAQDEIGFEVSFLTNLNFSGSFNFHGRLYSIYREAFFGEKLLKPAYMRGKRSSLFIYKK
jgi:hypothetical protein